MLQIAGIFGINNSSISLAVACVLIVLALIWLALIYWTFADARRRIDDPMLVGCATVIAFLPFVGSLVYMIVRPPEYLDDVRERDLEIQAAEARLAEIGVQVCPYCDYEIEKDFLRCPNCLRKLKEPCQSCGRPLDPSWQICPYCEQPVGQAAAKQQQRRRRRSPTQDVDVAGPTAAGGGVERGEIRGAARGGSGGGGARSSGGSSRGGAGPRDGGDDRGDTRERGGARGAGAQSGQPSGSDLI